MSEIQGIADQTNLLSAQRRHRGGRGPGGAGARFRGGGGRGAHPSHPYPQGDRADPQGSIGQIQRTLNNWEGMMQQNLQQTQSWSP